VKITLSAGDQQALIIISDNGPGIAPQHLGHIFERFYRVPERSAGVRGTGLGLFICQHIIKAHHGNIKVESQLSEGTSFHIHIPISEQDFSEVSYD
jgi:signal transduction histidine kinase